MATAPSLRISLPSFARLNQILKGAETLGGDNAYTKSMTVQQKMVRYCPEIAEEALDIAELLGLEDIFEKICEAAQEQEEEQRKLQGEKITIRKKQPSRQGKNTGRVWVDLLKKPSGHFP